MHVHPGRQSRLPNELQKSFLISLGVVIFQRLDYVVNMSSEMREPTFWVLTVLTGGRRHGYALMEEARALSDGRVNLKAATLYAALDRLGQQGWVALDGDEVVDGRLRRYFRITDDGATGLETEAARLEANAAQARTRLRARRTTTVPKAI